MAINSDFTLTSPAGRFVFSKGTILSHAKLIRDAITASFRGTIPSCPRIDATKPHLATMWIQNHLGGPIAKNVLFEWDPTGCWSN